ncbi:TetR family transcriptional regulator [Pararhizobium polonicum]|uniref:TetR family transcriptional regulator n=1 Tax=Pararhizobium polonicum TaxID=1612624 RepID=A0A1C7P7C0_9HYPH|nr:TetR/AcrR family transcriptional regulator [Pararhizobium polonicum]OBZ97087.1 TetR family transcriptional regulator [Pararhizobium polonicum]
MRRSNKERTESMRLALMAAARALFVENGYAETATPEIVSAAGVTRGALYHHFEDKRALFAAIVAEEARQVGQEIETAAVSKDARQAILAGTRAYFDAMAVPGRTRLLLLDGPAILGAHRLQVLDAEHSESRLKAGLADLFAASGKSADLLDAFTELLSASFDRAALAIEAGASRQDYEKAIATLIDGIFVR